jgi:hypothetical protein
LSFFTKILVVLLSLFSLFLCGAVATYVGTASNYKQLYEEQKNLHDSLVSGKATLQKSLNAEAALAKDIQAKLNDRIQLLEDEKSKLDVELKNAQRTSLENQGRVNSWVGVLTSFEKTIANLEQSLNLTQQQLSKAHGENIQDRKALNEITASLYEKIVQIQALEADRRRLREAKIGLEEQINRLWGPDSQPVSIETVTPEFGSARAAAPAVSGIALNGLITEVDKSLVSISLGSDDGVKKNMVLQVFRGAEFVCNLVVTDVDVSRSAGIPELVQQRPIVGDYVTTRL